MDDRCVCCGAIVPEGRMVCPNCLLTVKEGEDDGETESVFGEAGSTSAAVL